MKTVWDYTDLAKAYVSRPNYADSAIDTLLTKANLNKNQTICDIGAGTAHLTIPLLQRGFHVTAVEPNDAMRELGKQRTSQWPKVDWYEGTGEETKQASNSFDLVTFGSSFNVCDRLRALEESNRILKNGGWFACLWNHRDLNDSIQKDVEAIILSYIPGYNYGSRREDQTDIISKSKYFKPCEIIEGSVKHLVNKPDWIEAWRSHATLARQAGPNFKSIVDDIEKHVINNIQEDNITIPYTTRIWLTQKLQ